MSNQNLSNYYNNSGQYCNHYNYSNNNYGYYNQDLYSNQTNNNNNINNNYYNNNINNKYGKIVTYYNNNPVYSYIPPSIPSQNQNDIKVENLDSKEKENQKNTKLRRGIILNIKKEDMCYLRPPEFHKAYIGQSYGKPKYAEN